MYIQNRTRRVKYVHLEQNKACKVCDQQQEREQSEFIGSITLITLKTLRTLRTLSTLRTLRTPKRTQGHAWHTRSMDMHRCVYVFGRKTYHITNTTKSISNKARCMNQRRGGASHVNTLTRTNLSRDELAANHVTADTLSLQMHLGISINKHVCKQNTHQHAQTCLVTSSQLM